MIGGWHQDNKGENPVLVKNKEVHYWSALAGPGQATRGGMMDTFGARTSRCFTKGVRRPILTSHSSMPIGIVASSRIYFCMKEPKNLMSIKELGFANNSNTIFFKLDIEFIQLL